MIQEITVMGHHEQGQCGAREIILQPHDHLQVEVVRRLIEDEEVGLRDEHIGERHTFLLTTTKFFHRLMQVVDM